ncbi:hypothetical protein N658DRAFT_140299 [Parathielavia hyrcaniae]|uniref:Uncharacterized protein n=1 Tax=Parathielavia hyrcaniae TaxID=113614 RepID=A0AAN6PYI9_9PEZI|nr:hypothetical protein N658DRAFT_140299 [Parathielavia hyrcaniae]
MVVQEIALVKQATVHCGSKVVSWLDFSDVISLYGSRKDIGLEGVESGHGPGQGALALSFLSNNALRKDARGNILERRWSVEVLFALLPMFEARVPHDAIFAILSIASDSAEFNDVDYSQSPADLFTRVLKKTARKTRSLDMMFRSWAPDVPGDHRLPSFIAPASRHTYTRNTEKLDQRHGADGLVGPPRRPIYAATPPLANFPSEWLSLPRRFRGTWGCLDGAYRPTIHARGVVYAVISELGEACENGTIPGGWISAWREKGLRGEMPELWRAVVAGRSHDGNAPPNWYRRAFQEVFAGGGLGDGELSVNLPDRMKHKRPTYLTTHLDRVSACVWGRRFLISTLERPGYYGLVPRGAEPGDMICLLEGCSVPVVFRGKRVAELVLRALQRALPQPESLQATVKESIISSLRHVVLQALSGFVKGNVRKHLRPLFLGTAGGPNPSRPTCGMHWKQC